MRISPILIVVVLMLGTPSRTSPLVGLARADQDIPLDSAVQVITSMAGRIGNARWTVRTEHGTLSADNSFVATPSGTRGIVVFEPVSGRFRANFEAVNPWSGGPAAFVASRNQCAFDGSRLRLLRREKPGETPPPPKPLPDSPDGFPGEAKIYGDTEQFFSMWNWASGIGYFPPNIDGVGLPDRIRREQSQGRPVRITDDEQGIWHIEFVDAQMQPSNQIIVMDYDRSRGLVTTVTWKSKKTLLAWRRTTFEFQKIGAEYWVPKTVQNVYLLNKPRNADRLTFSDVKINEPIDERVYRIEFPAGSQVVDYVEKKAYVVGQAPKDEQELIKAFVRMNGLTAPPPVALWRRAIWYVVPAFALLLAMVFSVRRWRSRVVAAAVTGLLVAWSNSAIAADPAITRSVPGGALNVNVGQFISGLICPFDDAHLSPRRCARTSAVV